MRFFVPSWQVISLFLSLSLWSLVSRYLIAAGKCFQLTRSSGSLIFTFNFQEISSNSFKKIWYLFGNFDFCTEVESRRSRSYSEYWAVQGWYSGNRPRDSRFEYAQARRIRSLRGQIVFRIAWHFPTNIKCSAEVSMKMFLDILAIVRVFDDWLSASRQWKTLRLLFIQRSTSNPRQCLKSLEIPKETLYVFRRTKSTNSWKWTKFRIALNLHL